MELARALHRKKWLVGVACTCGPAARRIRREGFSVFPVEFCRESLNPWAVFRSLSQIRKAVCEFRPDLLAAVALRPILLVPLMRTGPTPATVNLLNGLGSLASGAHLPLWLRPASWWLRSLLGFAISRANCWTVTQNEADYQEARHLAGKASARVLKILGTGISFPLRPLVARPAHGRTRFLFVGRLLRDKGILELLEAFVRISKRHPDTFLEVIGTIDPANPASLTLRELKAWEDIPKVSWLGHRKDVPERMKAADCVVIPSYREGLPRVLLEAAAAARPVIVSDIPGCRELVDPEKTGLIVAPRNVSELATAMEQIHLQPAFRKRLALGLFRKVKKKCSIAHIGKAYENLFRRALGARHSRE